MERSSSVNNGAAVELDMEALDAVVNGKGKEADDVGIEAGHGKGAVNCKGKGKVIGWGRAWNKAKAVAKAKAKGTGKDKGQDKAKGTGKEAEEIGKGKDKGQGKAK